MDSLTPGSAMGQVSFSPEVRNWYRSFVQRYGSPPNMNDPSYDYQRAYSLGALPQPYAPDSGFPHWPSTGPQGQPLKAPDHPTRWMQDFMTQYGVDPNQAPPGLLGQGLQQGYMPGGLLGDYIYGAR